MEKDIELIPIEEKHLELVRNWRNSEEVSSFMYTSNFITPEDQKNWYRKISACPTSRYWIIKYDDKLLGVVSITEISHVFDSCFWAFYLGDTSNRSKSRIQNFELRIR